jgi:hypothetical protein
MGTEEAQSALETCSKLHSYSLCVLGPPVRHLATEIQTTLAAITLILCVHTAPPPHRLGSRFQVGDGVLGLSGPGHCLDLAVLHHPTISCTRPLIGGWGFDHLLWFLEGQKESSHLWKDPIWLHWGQAKQWGMERGLCSREGVQAIPSCTLKVVILVLFPPGRIGKLCGVCLFFVPFSCSF